MSPQSGNKVCTGCCFCLPASRARLCASSAVSVRTAVHHHESTFHAFRAINAAAPAVSSVQAVLFYLFIFFKFLEPGDEEASPQHVVASAFSKSEAFVDVLTSRINSCISVVIFFFTSCAQPLMSLLTSMFVALDPSDSEGWMHTCLSSIFAIFVSQHSGCYCFFIQCWGPIFSSFSLCSPENQYLGNILLILSLR